MLETDGERVPGIVGVRGLESSVEVIEYRCGDGGFQQMAGPFRFSSVGLQQDAGAGSPLLERWYQQVLAGKHERKSGAIVILDSRGETEVARYNFCEAWPARWKCRR